MKRLLTPTAVAALALAATPAAAVAHGGDRDHDGMRDRWEHRHHVHAAKADADHDGLRNRAEFRIHTDPRDRDSDDDGVRDDDEQAGTVKSFEDGVLTIALAAGGELTGTVDDDTEIKCETTAHSASNSGRGSDSSGRDDEGEDDRGEDRGEEEPGDDRGDDAESDDRGDDNSSRPSSTGPGIDPQPRHGDDDEHGHRRGRHHMPCGTDALTTGRIVEEADADVTSTGVRFDEIELK